MQNNSQHGYTIRFDADAGVVRVTMGCDMPDDIYVHYRADLLRALDEAHAAAPTARVLIDGRKMEVLPANAADQIAALSHAFLPGDRTAMIVRSSLLKMEARRVAHDPNLQTFVSENAAWTWLLAYDVPSAA